MLSPRTLFALVVSSCLSQTLISAAVAGDLVPPTGDIRTGKHIGFVPAFPYSPGYGYGWNYGFGDVIRARGEAERAFSEARINNEVARSLAIDNAAKAVETRLQTRALGKSVRLEFYARKRAGRAEYIARRRVEALERAAAEQQLLEPEGPAVAEPVVPLALNRN